MAEDTLILIVDDSKLNLDIYMQMLADHFDVAVALDGETAIETAEEDSPALILMDVLMPGLNGFEACKKLQENASTKNIPVLLISGENDAAAINSAKEAGAKELLAKDINETDLVKTILKYI